MLDLGTVRPGTTIYIPFQTFDSNDPSASVTITGLAVTDIEVYKDGSVTQRASDAGYTLLDTDGIDFDTITGIHGFSINLADNTTAGFWTAGSQFWVVVSAITVDAATVNFVAATFRIGYPDAVLNTTIATLASQTSFTLTSGPAEDDALNGCVVCIHDVASAVQLGFAVVSDYTGSTRTVTLTAGVTFTAAAGDNIAVYPPANARWMGQTAQTPNDVGDDANTLVSRVVGTIAAGTHQPQSGDAFARLGAPAGASVSADIAAIEAQTDDIGAAGAGLTAIPWNAAWDAEVESEVDDALGVGGADLTAVPWNAAWDAEVQSEVADALDAAIPSSPAAGSINEGVRNAVQALVIRRNTAQAGGATTITLDTGASASDDFYNNAYVVIAGGTGAGQARFISDYVGATRVATVNAAWITNPDATSVFIVVAFSTIPGASAPTAAEVADAVWDEASADHIAAGSTGERVERLDVIASGGTGGLTNARAANLDNLAGHTPQTGDSYARLGAPAGASVSADVAAVKADTDAILVDTGTTLQAELDGIQADTEDIQTRLPTALIGGRMDANAQVVGDKTGYAVGVGGIASTAFAAGAVDAAALSADATTEIRDAIWALAMTEPTAVPAVTASVKAALEFLLVLARNKITQTSTTQTLRNDADSATIGTASVSDDGSTFTRSEWS